MEKCHGNVKEELRKHREIVCKNLNQLLPPQKIITTAPNPPILMKEINLIVLPVSLQPLQQRQVSSQGKDTDENLNNGHSPFCSGSRKRRHSIFQ